ncbi:MAG: hypothetical protein V1656_01325 [Candidatus Jorgensenbacteria bacterium]
MENTTPGWGSPQPPKNLPTGEGEVPLASAPQPKVEVRTMGSDLRSIGEQGGGEPRPYVPKPAAPSSVFTPPTPGSTPSPFVKPSITFTPPGMGTAGLPTQAGLPTKPQVPSGVPAPVGAPKSKRGIFLGILSFFVVVGLAAVGYFFIYPMFAGTPAEPVVTPPAPIAEVPPVLPPEESSAVVQEPEVVPEPPVIPPVIPPVTAEVIAGIDTHASLLTIPADIRADVTLATVNVDGLRAALPFAQATVPLFREVTIKTAEGKVIVFGELAKRLVPGFFTAELIGYFADDATYITYAAADGTWFGFAVPLKSGVELGTVQGKMNALQRDPDNKNFFLTDPGAEGAWRDGNIKAHPASLVDFATPGATLGYTWLGRTLLLTTNLAAGEKAAQRLGF